MSTTPPTVADDDDDTASVSFNADKSEIRVVVPQTMLTSLDTAAGGSMSVIEVDEEDEDSNLFVIGPDGIPRRKRRGRLKRQQEVHVKKSSF